MWNMICQYIPKPECFQWNKSNTKLLLLYFSLDLLMFKKLKPVCIIKKEFKNNSNAQISSKEILVKHQRRNKTSGSNVILLQARPFLAASIDMKLSC